MLMGLRLVRHGCGGYICGSQCVGTIGANSLYNMYKTILMHRINSRDDEPSHLPTSALCRCISEALLSRRVYGHAFYMV